MFNSLEAYMEAGEKAGIAHKRQDVGAYRHWRDWFRAALTHEKTEEDRTTANTAYNEGYERANPPRKPEYFR